jgi:hypothetical protein
MWNGDECGKNEGNENLKVNTALSDVRVWTLRKVDEKYLQICEMWC